MHRSRRYHKAPLKKNLRKIPEAVTRRLAQIEGDIVVAAVRKIPMSAIARGELAHAGLSIVNGRCDIAKRVLPSRKRGRYSRRNLRGYTIKYMNEAKVTKTYSFEAPNWGDWSKGSHTVCFDRQVYRREFRSPKQMEIVVDVIGQEPGDEPWLIVRFAVDEVLRRGQPRFQESVFFNLNLLQENIGTCDVFPSNMALEEYLRTIYVHWEILPPGDRDLQISRIIGTNSKMTARERKAFEERYDYLMKFKPSHIVLGTSGFRRYFGAILADNLVVFENVEYGNAVYVMFEDWEELSKRSRTELLNSSTDKFVRIPHQKGWKDRLRIVLKERWSASSVVATGSLFDVSSC